MRRRERNRKIRIEKVEKNEKKQTTKEGKNTTDIFSYAR